MRLKMQVMGRSSFLAATSGFMPAISETLKAMYTGR